MGANGSANNTDQQTHSTKPKMGSDRSFGFVFAVVFALVGLFPLLGAAEPRYWALVLAGVFAGAALAVPGVLRPLNKLWYRLGLALHKVVSPLIMALLFLTTVTPIAIIMRGLGKDLLNQKLDPNADSYWIPREASDRPYAETMKRQF